MERNLRGSWCDGLAESSPTDDGRYRERKGSVTGEYTGGTGWSSGMGGRRDVPGSPGGVGGALGSPPGSACSFDKERMASTLSVDAVAREEGRRNPRRSASGDTPSRQASGSNTPLSSSVILEQPGPGQVSAAESQGQRLTSMLFPPHEGRHAPDPSSREADSLVRPMEALSASGELPKRRRAAPPPPVVDGASRPRTPQLDAAVDLERKASPATGMRRPAPEPPSAGRRKVAA